MKKFIITALAATSLLIYSTPSFALISVSVGIPISHTITGNTGRDADYNNSYGNKAAKSSGYFLGASFASIGLGIDSYTTKFKVGSGEGEYSAHYDAGLKTNMTNIFYLLPIPVVNIIIGLGMGTQEMDCTVCGPLYDKGSATQWLTSIGLPIIPFLTYISVTAPLLQKTSSISQME